MGALIAAASIPVGFFLGVCIVLWLIWQGIKSMGRRFKNWLLGPEDITP